MNEIQELAARVRERELKITAKQEFALHKARRIQQSAMDIVAGITHATEEAQKEFNAGLPAGSGSVIEYFSRHEVPSGFKLIRGTYPAVNLTVKVDPDNQRITADLILTDKTRTRHLSLIFPLELDDNTVRIDDGERPLTDGEFAKKMIDFSSRLST